MGIINTAYLPSPQNAVSSGCYDIAFEEVEWLGAIVYVSDARFMTIAGTQMVTVSGYITFSEAVDASGTVTFTLPFKSSSAIVGATSVCESITGDPDPGVREAVPCYATSTDGTTSFYIYHIEDIVRLNYTVTVMTDII